MLVLAHVPGATQEGDAIMAAAADGTLTTDTVSSLSIAKPEAEATFVKIMLESGAELDLTPEHHLPVGPECCSVLKKAKAVEIGETLWTATGAKRVVATGATIGKGLHSPVMTNGGFPIVDGVVTSFDGIASVTLASYGLKYVEPILSVAMKGASMASMLQANDAVTAPTTPKTDPLTPPLVAAELAK